MWIRALAFALAVGAPSASGQTIAPAGADDTFDVATWNVEYFGEDGDGDPPHHKGPPVEGQLDNVTAIVSQAEIDVWAIQEIAAPGTTADPVTWPLLLERLAPLGYAGVLSVPPAGGVIRNGFIYDPDVVTLIRTESLFRNASHFGGRRPFVLVAEVLLGGAPQTVHLVAFHADGGEDPDSHQNRQIGADRLKEYVEALPPGEPAILLGDFNDYLTKARWNGCPTEDDCGAPPPPSPYATLVNDDRYRAPTVRVENRGLPTYCSDTPRPWEDPLCGGEGNMTIDHIVHTSDLANPVEVARYDSALAQVPDFVTTTSDHAPVFARFAHGAPAALGGPANARAVTPSVALLAPVPNPFRSATTLRFRVDAATDVQLDVVDALGRRVLRVERSVEAGEHAVPLRGDALAPGPYVVRLVAGETTRSSVLVRAE